MQQSQHYLSFALDLSKHVLIHTVPVHDMDTNVLLMDGFGYFQSD